jgi:hypothetical protein
VNDLSAYFEVSKPFQSFLGKALYYNTYNRVTVAYSIQYSNMLYRFELRSNRLYHIAYVCSRLYCTIEVCVSTRSHNDEIA